MASNDILPDDYDKLKPRKGKAIPVSKRRLTVGSKSTIARTVKRTPEVMIKISSSAKNMRKVQKNVDYISRKGTVPLEDEQSNVYFGGHAKADALHTWAESIPASGEKRRETFNIIFSMPKDTPRKEVTEAVRRFAADKFKNHQYLFAAHDDEDHPHVHVIVKAEPLEGKKRLNPRKADLQKWREGFAERLHELGIEANATPRAARGVTRKADKQAVIHINERAERTGKPARVTEAQKQVALDELNGKPKPEPFKPALLDIRKQVLTEYEAVAKQLVKGSQDDKQLAVDVTKFAQSLPLVETQHDKRVSDLQQQQSIEPQR